jgi:UDP-glucose 4-epimerase
MLVIGSAGFIGSHVVDQLVRKDVGEIRICDDLTLGVGNILEAGPRDPRVKVFQPGGNYPASRSAWRTRRRRRRTAMRSRRP